jgi:hypothetical protein
MHVATPINERRSTSRPSTPLASLNAYLRARAPQATIILATAEGQLVSVIRATEEGEHFVDETEELHLRDESLVIACPDGPPPNVDLNDVRRILAFRL